MQDQVDSLEKQTSEVVEKNYEEEHRLRREKGPLSQFYLIHPCILLTIFAYDVSSSALYLWLDLLINNKQIILSYTLLLLYDEIF